MKKIFYVNLSVILFGLIAICVFNYLIDPSNIFKRDTEIKHLVKKKINIGVNFNIDERKFKSYLLENVEKIDVLITGSSRVMTLNNSLFLNKKIFNSGVSGAGLEDQIAFIDIYRRKFKMLPKEVILGIDPWVFNLDSDIRYKTIEENYFNLKKDISTATSEKFLRKKDGNKYKVLITYAYLKDSLEIFKKNKYTIPKFKFMSIPNDAIDEFQGNIYRMEDYSLVYPKDYREKNRGQHWKDSLHYQLNGFKKINLSLKNDFEDLIKFLLKNGVKVSIYLPPYSPNLYTEYKKNYPNYYNLLNDIENYLVQIGIRNNIKIIGSYNSDKFNLQQTDFYDGIHLRRSKVSKILRASQI